MKRNILIEIALILTLLAFTIFLRYPPSQHEIGVDGFLIHIMTNRLMILGQAPWVANALSYVGLFPYSQPSGLMFTLGAFSLVSGMTMEPSIIIYDWLLAIIGVLGVFIMDPVERDFCDRQDSALLIIEGCKNSLGNRGRKKTTGIDIIVLLERRVFGCENY